VSEPRCPNCKDLKSKVWLAWQCERCGWIEGASHIHDVYDAAMAWNKTFDGCDMYDIEDAINALRSACRAAREAEEE